MKTFLAFLKVSALLLPATLNSQHRKNDKGGSAKNISVHPKQIQVFLNHDSNEKKKTFRFRFHAKGYDVYIEPRHSNKTDTFHNRGNKQVMKNGITSHRRSMKGKYTPQKREKSVGSSNEKRMNRSKLSMRSADHKLKKHNLGRLKHNKKGLKINNGNVKRQNIKHSKQRQRKYKKRKHGKQGSRHTGRHKKGHSNVRHRAGSKKQKHKTGQDKSIDGNQHGGNRSGRIKSTNGKKVNGPSKEKVTVIKGTGKYRPCVYAVPVPKNKKRKDHVTLHIKCKSINGKRSFCGVPVYGQILTMIVRKKFSKKCCVNRQSFGITKHNNVWVSKGCWAEFIITVHECHHITRHLVDCGGAGRPRHVCNVPGNGNILSIRVMSSERHQNSAKCKYYRTYGPTIENNLWVSNGCTATFAVKTRRSPKTIAYMFMCNSHNFQYRMCCVPGKGKVIQLVVLKQYSRFDCVYKRSYGRSKSNNIWVHRGCRAMFKIIKYLE